MKKRRPFNPKRRTNANIARAAEKKAAAMQAIAQDEDAFMAMFSKMRISPKRQRTVRAPDDNRIPRHNSVRKSGRKTEHQMMREVLEDVKRRVAMGTNEHLVSVFMHPVKGRGLQANVPFAKNEFVVEYRGTMLTYDEARRVEDQYAQNEKIGSYMFFFEHAAQKWCVDATAETVFKGRLVNHSRRNPNLKAAVIVVNGEHRLILYANKHIQAGDELLYDYGDRSSAVIANNPWLLE